MALPNAYSQYNNDRIMMAKPAELTLMLYEGAIKFCNIGIMAMEQKDIAKAHNNIVRAEKIIAYLRATLDMQFSVAQDFENIYVYLERRMRDANIKKDSMILEEVCTHLRSVRDSWKEVMRVNRESGAI